MKAMQWLHAHDRDYAALRRAARAALVMPAMFALADKVIGNPVIATFAAFGSFAMLLLVDFAGSIRARLEAEATLAVACCVLIALGTLASRNAWLAGASMAVVGFAVIFSGVVSSVLAGATTPLLLSYILPVTLKGPASSIPDRIAGWGLASVAALFAISLLWPAPAHNPIRGTAINACRALAKRLRTEVAYVLGGQTEPLDAERKAAIADADKSVQALETSFFATPYRPTGLSTPTRAVVRLVDELQWLNAVVLRSSPQRIVTPSGSNVCAVKKASATALEFAADLLEAPSNSRQALDAALAQLREALQELERVTTSRLPATADGTNAVVSSLDPSFRAQELSFVVAQIATNTEFAAAAERRGLVDRLLGRQPAGFASVLSAARERAGSHMSRQSLSLRNSVRGAAGLGVAVLVADLSGVQHAFWVVFGTLAVLRSSALNTGQNIVRALLGTAAGFIVGAILVTLIGTNTTVLWALLPIAILLAGLAPATVSFAAGQAAFTLVLLILFNILAPAGWKIGLVRIEDVALGCAVSLVVGLLFWPRGAAAALGRALSEAYVDSIDYLSSAVAYGVGRCDASGPSRTKPIDESTRAAAAARRLDDTFRGYLAERGAKRVRLAEVTRLVTGVSGLRLAADAVIDLWDGDDGVAGDRAGARANLLQRAQQLNGWYDGFAASLTGTGAVPEPLATDDGANERLAETVVQDLRDPDGNGTATGVRVIWTGDHLDAVRRVQTMLVGPAREAVSEEALL
jgi:Fusaric acid resistance protein-like